jgi:hypothetical protein
MYHHTIKQYLADKMNEKYTITLILLIVMILAIVGIVLMMKTSNTGDATYLNSWGKVQGRPRPGDWNYQGAQPYSNVPRNMPAGQTQQDTFIRPG